MTWFRWLRTGALSKLLSNASVLAGEIVIDCNNTDMPADFRFVRSVPSLAEKLAADVPQARVVKAFNTMAAPAARSLTPCTRSDRTLPTLPIAGLGWWHHPRAALVTLEWPRIDQTTVVGRLTARDFQLVLETYFPYLGSVGGPRASIRSTTRARPSSGNDILTTFLAVPLRFVVWWTSPRSAPGSIRLPRNCAKT